jgi:hypothetical protein
MSRGDGKIVAAVERRIGDVEAIAMEAAILGTSPGSYVSPRFGRRQKLECRLNTFVEAKAVHEELARLPAVSVLRQTVSPVRAASRSFGPSLRAA